MNRETAARILRHGKALAPDRFPALPRDAGEARAVLDAWVDSLGTVNLPDEVWRDAVTLWATTLVGERMATPRDLIQAAYTVRDRWENDPARREVLETHRLVRLNANYARMGLDGVDRTALPPAAAGGAA